MVVYLVQGNAVGCVFSGSVRQCSGSVLNSSVRNRVILY